MGLLSDDLVNLLRRCLAEFIGTFFLVFFVGLSNLSNFGPFVPGLTLMVFVFNFGHVSLGAFNPAISLALTLRPVFYCASFELLIFPTMLRN
jgi:aquaporin Z